MNPLAEWQNFYVVVGGAAGALTGLQFVVMALIADMPVKAHEIKTANAFATPTIVHFSAATLLAATFAAPWDSLIRYGFGLWTISGLAGLGYVVHVALRMVRQDGYKPVFEDWFFHTILPMLAYGTLAASAIAAPFVHRVPVLFFMAATLLLLLIVGIHNAWDNVTYLVLLRHERKGDNA